MRRWKKLAKDSKPDVNTAILANTIHIQNNDKKKNEQNKELQNFHQEEIDMFWQSQAR